MNFCHLSETSKTTEDLVTHFLVNAPTPTSPMMRFWYLTMLPISRQGLYGAGSHEYLQNNIAFTKMSASYSFTSYGKKLDLDLYADSVVQIADILVPIRSYNVCYIAAWILIDRWIKSTVPEQLAYMHCPLRSYTVRFNVAWILRDQWIDSVALVLPVDIRSLILSAML